MVLRRFVLTPLLGIACFSEPSDVSGTESSTSTSDDGGTSITNASTTTASATGSVDTSTSASTSTTSGDTLTSSVDTNDASETGSECPLDQVPAPLVPAGWSGPHVLLPGEAEMMLPACPDSLGASTPDVAFAGGHASCGCTCAPRCNVSWREAGGIDCTDGDMVAVSGGADLECIPFFQPGWIGNIGTPAVPECESNEVTPHADSLAWDTRFRVCESAGPCVVVPGPAIGPCVRHDGDELCEDPLLPNKHLLAGDGAIACGACGSCASGVVDACAAATVRVYQSPACGGIVQQEIDAQSCSLDDTYTDAEMHVDEVTCNDTPATVTPTNVVTFCCA